MYFIFEVEFDMDYTVFHKNLNYLPYVLLRFYFMYLCNYLRKIEPKWLWLTLDWKELN